jgi:hypothetical protein
MRSIDDRGERVRECEPTEVVPRESAPVLGDEDGGRLPFYSRRNEEEDVACPSLMNSKSCVMKVYR